MKTTTKEKRAIYAGSLICQNNESNVFYNIQIIEVDRENDQWRIDVQHGVIGTSGTIEEGKVIMNLRPITKKMQEMIAAKISGGGGREYHQTETVVLPYGIKIMPPSEVNTIAGNIKTRKNRSHGIDRKDPDLLRLINDDRIVAVVVPDIKAGTTLEYAAEQVQIGGKSVLAPESPIAKSAKRIGEDFLLGGYLIGSVFHVVDVLEEKHREKTFSQRLAIIDDLVGGSATRGIIPCQFHYGKNEKEAAVEQAIKQEANIKFISLDENQNNGSEHVFPPVM